MFKVSILQLDFNFLKTTKQPPAEVNVRIPLKFFWGDLTQNCPILTKAHLLL